MNFSHSSKSNGSLLSKPRLASLNDKKMNQSSSQFYKLPKFNLLNNKRKSTVQLKKPASLKAEHNVTTDEIFKSLLDPKKPKKLEVKQINRTLENVKGTHITLSKKTFMEIMKNYNKMVKKDKPDEDKQNGIFAVKTIKSHVKPLSSILDKNKTEELKNKALKDLLDENFDASSKRDIKSNATSEETLIKLYQKELLFEQVLNSLTEDGIDINTLLYSAFEKLQSDNYITPSNTTFIEDGYFVLEDKVKLPTPKWKKQSFLRNELKINLSKVKSES